MFTFCCMIIIRRCKMLTLTLLLIGDHPKRRKDARKQLQKSAFWLQIMTHQQPACLSHHGQHFLCLYMPKFFFSIPFFIATVKFWSLQLVKRKNAAAHVPEAQQGNYTFLLVLYSRWFDSPKSYLYTFENRPGVEHTTKKKRKCSTSSSGASARYFRCPCIFLVMHSFLHS